MSLGGLASEGDNIEFTAVNTGDYTIFLQHNSNTSANDTETKKYSDNAVTAINISIRVDKNSDLVQMNENIFTNPITIVADKEHTEKRRVPIIGRIIIRTNSADTKIKVRWF